MFKIKITKNFLNLQEWHQNMQNCKSLFQQIFIIKHSQWEQKLKTCQEQPDLVCGRFLKVLCKTTTCPRQTLLSGSKSDYLVLA